MKMFRCRVPMTGLQKPMDRARSRDARREMDEGEESYSATDWRQGSRTLMTYTLAEILPIHSCLLSPSHPQFSSEYILQS